MRLAELLERAGLASGGAGDESVTGFAIDHRKVAPGTVFGAFAGARFNGEDFIPAAIEAGETTFSMTAMGLPYAQGVFKYQVKCLGDLRARYAALDSDAKAKLDPLLVEAGCLIALQAG